MTDTNWQLVGHLCRVLGVAWSAAYLWRLEKTPENAVIFVGLAAWVVADGLWWLYLSTSRFIDWRLGIPMGEWEVKAIKPIYSYATAYARRQLYWDAMAKATDPLAMLDEWKEVGAISSEEHSTWRYRTIPPPPPAPEPPGYFKSWK